MNKNTLSLLSSNWNIADNYSAVLYPFLFQIIKGTEISEKTALPETMASFVSETLLQSQSFPVNQAKNTFEKSVALIQIHHPIFKYDQTCGPKGTQSIMQILEEFKTDDSIAGVVMDFNSGGGQASGNSEFAEYINEFKNTKPIVSYTNGFMCSAAYYMAAASSKIVINKHADLIGSLGTMLKNIDLDGAIEKAGGTINELYATKSTLKNKVSRDLKAGNTDAVIKELLDPHRDIFENDMRLYRPQLNEEVFNGAEFNPTKAIELGLGDELGTIKDAVNLVFSLSKPKTNTNKNNTNMKIEKFNQINALLGVEGLEANDNGVFLNEDQLQALENNFATQAAAVQTAQDAQNTAQDNLTLAQNDAQAVNSAIQAALTEAEVENAENLNAVQGIEALSGLVAEYGSRDGAQTTTVVPAVNGKSANNNIVGGMDISAALNN